LAAPWIPLDGATACFEADFTSLLFVVLWDWPAGAFLGGCVDFFADFLPLFASFSVHVGQVNS
jgi:hypothetical protein